MSEWCAAADIPLDRWVLIIPTYQEDPDEPPIVAKFSRMGGTPISKRKWMLFSDTRGTVYTPLLWKEI